MAEKIIDIEQLAQDQHNFNKGSEQGQELMERSFKEMGAGRSILIDRNGNIIAGNKSQKAAIAAGIKKVRIIETTGDELVAVKRTDVDIDSAEGRKMAYLDNLTTQVNLTWDETEIQAVQADVEGFDVGDFGVSIDQLPGNPFDVKEPTGETTQTEQPQAEEDDFDPDEVHETKVKTGDVWLLGEHRLMCGDSTDAECVAKLMNGERADLVFTDPPYGMNLDTDYSSMQSKLAIADEKHLKGGNKYDAGHVDDFTPDMVQAVLNLDAKETFIWGADYFAELIPNRNDGSFIVWDKRANEGGTIEQDESSDKMFGSCFELCWSKAKHKRDIARVKWAGIFGMEQEPDRKRVHPTQKPIALVAWFLNRYGKEGDIVTDIFGGSGSTLIACEQLNRKCRMMELDPHYCTVIIARWEKLTGQKAYKEL